MSSWRCPRRKTQQKVHKNKKEGQVGGGRSPILVEDEGNIGGEAAASQQSRCVDGQRDAEKKAEAVDPMAAADPWRRIGPTSTGASSSLWAAFLANARLRPDGLSGAPPRSQASITWVRPGVTPQVAPAREAAITGAGGGGGRGGADHRGGGPRDAEPDLFISRQAVVGPYPIFNCQRRSVTGLAGVSPFASTRHVPRWRAHV